MLDNCKSRIMFSRRKVPTQRITWRWNRSIKVSWHDLQKCQRPVETRPLAEIRWPDIRNITAYLTNRPTDYPLTFKTLSTFSLSLAAACGGAGTRKKIGLHADGLLTCRNETRKSKEC